MNQKNDMPNEANRNTDHFTFHLAQVIFITPISKHKLLKRVNYDTRNIGSILLLLTMSYFAKRVFPISGDGQADEVAAFRYEGRGFKSSNRWSTS